MNYKRFALALACATLVSALAGLNVQAQCPTSVLASGLKAPVKIIFAQRDELLVAESGNGPNTGRVSVITLRDGQRRTLLDGLPSGFSVPNNDPSGPSGWSCAAARCLSRLGWGMR
jgi:hypothetical protein